MAPLASSARGDDPRAERLKKRHEQKLLAEQQMQEELEAARLQRSRHNDDNPLINLPAELRNRIWELVIPSNTELNADGTPATYFKRHLLVTKDGKCRKPVPISNYLKSRPTSSPSPPLTPRVCKDCGLFYNYPKSRPDSSPAPPPITQVCEALRPETSGLFYGSNVFEICVRYHHCVCDERRLAHCPGLAMMQKIVVTYFEYNDVFLLQLLLNLKDGVVEHVTFTNLLISRVHGRKFKLMDKSWTKTSDGVYSNEGGYKASLEEGYSGMRIGLPVTTAAAKTEEARLSCGFGNGEEVTAERVMKIVKVFKRNRFLPGSESMHRWAGKVLRGEVKEM